MSKRLLIVDDESVLAENLQKFFQTKGLDVSVALDGQSGIEASRLRQFDVIILDLHLPDMSGLEALATIKEECPSTGVIMFTAYGDVSTAVQAIQQKADNFVLKPVDLKVLDSIVQRVLQSYQRDQDVLYLKSKLSEIRGDQRLRELLLPPEVAQAVQLLADNPATNVLILGETGTGKGVLANAIHALSDRREAQLVDINCAGLSDTLLESELFGHEKGAFTDAKNYKRGLLEVAHGGSLFLDEVGELSLPVQAKLLKVIEDRAFRRLGGTASLRVDVRLMAATNAELEKRVQSGQFRSDLYYRLNVMPLTVPPLRQRREDILPLTRRFVQEFNTTFRKSIRGCSTEAETMLGLYAWPGNIRELRNVLERAVLLCRGDEIMPAHLPDNLRTRARTAPLAEGDDWSLEALEARHIAQVLDALAGNRSRAAEALGIHRATLIKKVKKYGLA